MTVDATVERGIAQRTATEAVERALARLAEVDRPELWITLRDADTLRSLAADVDARVSAGDPLPLAGWTVAVKDNIDVAGLPTTAASPRVLRTPDDSADTVARLESAGAIVVGKTNLDQFATGLVGARSPYGAPRSAGSPEADGSAKISGGSSSGSAVATALGIVDIALGTDTAGSGRVPAAFNSIVGIKPTLGLLSLDGVVPASPSYDTVSVFARDLATARIAVQAMTVGGTPRSWPAGAPFMATGRTIGVAREADLAPVTPQWLAGYRASIAAAIEAGATIVEIDVSPLVDIAKLLYGGALLAERAFAFGTELRELGADADPTVAGIVLGASDFRAVDLVRDQQALVRAKGEVEKLWAGIDALLVPTAPGHPGVDELAADPVGKNAWVGTYTNFVNLLDLSALAVPAPGSTQQAPVGVTLVGPAFADHALAELAALVSPGAAAADTLLWGAAPVELAVFGAHRAGQVLNRELVAVGARLLGEVRTSADYRMARLSTIPPKPGVYRVEAGAGAELLGELWALPPAGFGAFAQCLVAPMVIGQVQLDDGRTVLGFLCEPAALDGADDITGFGDWVAAQAAR